MTALRFTAAELQAAQARPLPWWSASARWELDRVAPGQPCQETDDEENETGFYVMSHPDIDIWDEYTLDVMRAGWAYVQSRADGEDIADYQQAVDWAAWQQLDSLVIAGSITKEQAVTQARAYMLTLGRSLGVPDPVEDDQG